MSPVAAIVGGGLVSSIIGGHNARKAARAQGKSAKQNLELQKQIYDQQRQDLSPFRDTGVDALRDLANLNTHGGQDEALRSFYNSDEYRTLSDQAQRQELTSSEATGNLGSSSTENDLRRIAPTLGLQNIQNQRNYLGNLANIGLSGAGQTAAFGSQYAGQAASGLNQLGRINAGGALASASGSIGSGISQLGSLYALSQLSGGIGQGLGLQGSATPYSASNWI